MKTKSLRQLNSQYRNICNLINEVTMLRFGHVDNHNWQIFSDRHNLAFKAMCRYINNIIEIYGYTVSLDKQINKSDYQK